MSNTVWIFAEHQRGEITESSLEVVCEARRLAGLRRGELCALLFGHQVADLANTLARYGAETVYLADHEAFAAYHPELFTDMLAGLARTYEPGILLLSSSMLGQDLGPRVAARLRTTLIPNCDKLELSDEGFLLQTRLIYQNKVHATVVCPGGTPQMASLAPGIFKIKEAVTPKGIRIVPVAATDFLQPGPQRIEVTGFIKADPKTVDISDAALIVSGGKGVQDDAGFQLIWDLADVLDATVAGSRMAVDNRWIDKTRQIGQSGTTVSPDLMISCGVSGATAHIFGLRETKTLIAINKDKAAPIMKMADLAVVGDLHEILPVLIKRLRDINAPKA